MTEATHFSRRIVSGNIFKPWLILGPLYEDLGAVVQGLTLFGKPGATVGAAAMEEIVTQARPILASSPQEGVEAVFPDQAATWSLVRRPEEYLSWGRYNISNHLGAAFLTTIVRPEEAGTYHWRLTVGISLRALVAVDGELVFDTELSPVAQEHGIFVYRFEAPLAAGDTRVIVALFRLGRMAQIGCRLELDDAEVAVRVPLGRAVLETRRQAIEQEVNGLRLERDVFYPHHPVGVEFATAPGGRVHLALFSDGRTPLREMWPQNAGPAQLCLGEELADGDYQLRTIWPDDTGNPMTSVVFDIKKVTAVTAPIGYDRIAERSRPDSMRCGSLMLPLPVLSGRSAGSPMATLVYYLRRG